MTKPMIIAFFVVRTIVKRKGRKGCCGSGSDYKPRKKKLKNVIATKVFVVDGMHCEKCANRVTEVVNDIPGAAGVVAQFLIRGTYKQLSTTKEKVVNQ